MASKLVTAPRLPNAPETYSAAFMSGFMRILNTYFNQLDSPGPMAASTQRNGTRIVSGLSFVQPGTTAGTFVVSLPTQADLANLRTGDVYYDTSAGNVLKIVP